MLQRSFVTHCSDLPPFPLVCSPCRWCLWCSCSAILSTGLWRVFRCCWRKSGFPSATSSASGATWVPAARAAASRPSSYSSSTACTRWDIYRKTDMSGWKWCSRGVATQLQKGKRLSPPTFSVEAAGHERAVWMHERHHSAEHIFCIIADYSRNNERPRFPKRLPPLRSFQPTLEGAQHRVKVIKGRCSYSHIQQWAVERFWVTMHVTPVSWHKATLVQEAFPHPQHVDTCCIHVPLWSSDKENSETMHVNYSGNFTAKTDSTTIHNRQGVPRRSVFYWDPLHP